MICGANWGFEEAFRKAFFLFNEADLLGFRLNWTFESGSSPMIMKLLLSCAVAASFLLTPLSSDALTQYGLDLHGKPVSELAGPGVSVVVLYFAATDCPISNRLIPEVARLRQEFGSKGVRLWWVYPNDGDDTALIEKHRKDFSIGGDALIDREQSLVKMAHATVTPEAAVFEVEPSGLHEVYHGRIDDRYISLGQERPNRSTTIWN